MRQQMTKNQTRMIYALLGAVGLFIAGPIAMAWAQQSEEEVAISVKDLPPAIQKALGDVELIPTVVRF